MAGGGEVRITRADAGRLASKLEATMDELSDQERNVLGLILARAARASESDVEGFAMEAYLYVKGQKSGHIKGTVTKAAGFGPGVDMITVPGGLEASGPQVG